MSETVEFIGFRVDPLAGSVMVRVFDQRTGAVMLSQEFTPAEARAFGDGVFRAAGAACAMEAAAGG